MGTTSICLVDLISTCFATVDLHIQYIPDHGLKRHRLIALSILTFWGMTLTWFSVGELECRDEAVSSAFDMSISTTATWGVLTSLAFSSEASGPASRQHSSSSPCQKRKVIYYRLPFPEIFLWPFCTTDQRQLYLLQLGKYPDRDTACVNHCHPCLTLK